MNSPTSVEITNIYSSINKLLLAANDVSSTGWVSLGAKQELYRIKWHIDDAIKRCPNFGEEEQDWLRTQEHKKIIKILSNDI